MTTRQPKGTLSPKDLRIEREEDLTDATYCQADGGELKGLPLVVVVVPGPRRSGWYDEAYPAYVHDRGCVPKLARHTGGEVLV